MEGTMFDLVYSVESNNIGSDNVSLYTTLLAWFPPVGPLGFHRYYTNNYVNSLFFIFFTGCMLIHL